MFISHSHQTIKTTKVKMNLELTGNEEKIKKINFLSYVVTILLNFAKLS